jgi:hypothetical protein
MTVSYEGMAPDKKSKIVKCILLKLVTFVHLLLLKRPGRGIDHSPPSSARVKERVELYLYFPSGHSWLLLGRTLPFILLTMK